MRFLSLLAVVAALLLGAAPAWAGDVLFVSDSTTDSENIPAVLSGGSAEVPHATIAGAGFRPAATTADHDVTIIRNDYVVTGGVFALAEGTNPTLAGLTAGVTLSDYCAIFWSASGPHEPDALGGGLGADGGVHNDPAVFTSLSSYVAAGGWVFVTGHDAAIDPSDPLLLAFLGAGAAGQAVRALPNAPAPGSIAPTATFLTTAVTDIRGLVPGAGTPAGVNSIDGTQDLDALGTLGADVIGLVAETLFAGTFQWTVRVPSGLGDLGDPTAGRIAYVAGGTFLFEDLPFNPGVFLSDGEDAAWLSDPAYNAALRNFAAAACPVLVDIVCPPTPQTLECNALGGRSETFSFVFTVPAPLTFDLEWTIDGTPGSFSPIVATLGVGDTLTLNLGPEAPATVWSPGAHTIVVTATTTAGAVSQCTVEFEVVDTTPPVVTLNGPAAVTVGCGTPYMDAGATATDICDGSLPVAVGGDTVDTSMSGLYVVTYTATDAAGNSTTETREVTVEGTTPPVLVSSMLRTLLWPARGGLIPVGLNAAASDDCGSLPVQIAVYSDEAEGLPPFAPDALHMGTASSLRLRMERQYPGNGRVYVVVVTASNGAGTTRRVHTAIVPLMPVGSFILNVQAQAAAAAAGVDPLTGIPAAPYDNLITTFSAAP